MKKNIIIGVLVVTNLLAFAFIQKQASDMYQTQVFQVMQNSVRQQEEANLQIEQAHEAATRAKQNAMAAAYEAKAQRDLVTELQTKVK